MCGILLLFKSRQLKRKSTFFFNQALGFMGRIERYTLWLGFSKEEKVLTSIHHFINYPEVQVFKEILWRLKKHKPNSPLLKYSSFHLNENALQRRVALAWGNGWSISEGRDQTVGFTGHSPHFLSFKIQTRPQNSEIFMVSQRVTQWGVNTKRKSLIWLAYLFGELSSKFIKTKNRICKPKKRQSKCWWMTLVSGTTQTQICLCVHLLPLTLLCYFCITPLISADIFLSDKMTFLFCMILSLLLNALTALF